MQPLLLLVHVEPMFRKYFPDKMYVPRLIKAARHYETIHFTSEVECDNPIEELVPLVNRQVYWGWGHEPGMFYDEEEQWCIPSPSPHQWTYVPQELRALKGTKRPIILGGCCDGECLLNMETCLQHLEFPYRKVDGYVYAA